MRGAAACIVAHVLVAAAHYGDPNTASGCLKDEVAVSLKGLSGRFCSPPCIGKEEHCPADVPDGVTATPTCDVTIAVAKFCSLLCDPNASSSVVPAQCGHNASCKALSGTGLCTYDDIPPKPSSEHWAQVNSPSFQALTTAMAVGFTNDGKVGFSGAGQDGTGAEIVRTEDYGATWSVLNGSKGSFDIFLGTAVKNETAAVITGASYNAFSTDGAHFAPSTNLWLSATPSVGVVPSSGLFATPFATEGMSGVATSAEGKTWKRHALTGLDPVIFQARYGTFPEECTWYVSVGAFPAMNSSVTDNGESYLRTNKGVRVNRNTSRAELIATKTSGGVYDPVQNCSTDPMNCYAAGIVKTTDCGATWATLFKNVNTGDHFYPNGIDCATAEHCVAVFEGDTCRVLVTVNGGQLWSETMHDTDPACSLVSVRMISEKEGWITGAHLTGANLEGRFWHTLDGGQTWAKEAIEGLVIQGLWMEGSLGYAVAVTREDGVALLKYRVAPVDDGQQ